MLKYGKNPLGNVWENGSRLPNNRTELAEVTKAQYDQSGSKPVGRALVRYRKPSKWLNVSNVDVHLYMQSFKRLEALQLANMQGTRLWDKVKPQISVGVLGLASFNRFDQALKGDLVIQYSWVWVYVEFYFFIISMVIFFCEPIPILYQITRFRPHCETLPT